MRNILSDTKQCQFSPLAKIGVCRRTYQLGLQQVEISSDSRKSTALENRATGGEGPETELELGTYALSRSFSPRATDPGQDPSGR